MLRSLRDLQDFTLRPGDLRAGDREFGELIDFIFDDYDWAVRYAVVRLDDRHILLSTYALAIPDMEEQVILVSGDLDQILASPIYQPSQPLTREQEAYLSGLFDWPRYWDRDVPNTLPGDLSAIPLVDMELNKEPAIPTTGSASASQPKETHLHSANQVYGYELRARDGQAGKLSDFIFDDHNWNLDYLVVDTGGLLSGKKVLVSPQWIQQFDWDRSHILIDLKKETIHNSPEYSSAGGITPDYWTNVTDYYQQDQE